MYEGIDKWLPLLIEECAEVTKAATKIMRFGSGGVYLTGEDTGRRNDVALAMEIGDLLEIINKINFDSRLVNKGRKRKLERLQKWGPEVKEKEHE